MSFPDYETIQEWLGEELEALPEAFFEGLNLGVVLMETIQYHEKSRPESPLFILGQYQRSGIGAQIVIYYGSFRAAYRGYSEERIREELRGTLRHEFRHHMEIRSGFRDLEEEDAYYLAKYEERFREHE
ncbi:MAG TPA: hypothetical protein GX717_06145 [Clostridiaceae bacterium]|nr:hypothetical protein [Clostridiaceae bacterium]